MLSATRNFPTVVAHCEHHELLTCWTRTRKTSKRGRAWACKSTGDQLGHHYFHLPRTPHRLQSRWIHSQGLGPPKCLSSADPQKPLTLGSGEFVEGQGSWQSRHWQRQEAEISASLLKVEGEDDEGRGGEGGIDRKTRPPLAGPSVSSDAIELSSSDEEPSDQPGKKWARPNNIWTTSEVIDLTGKSEWAKKYMERNQTSPCISMYTFVASLILAVFCEYLQIWWELAASNNRERCEKKNTTMGTRVSACILQVHNETN